MSIDKLIQKAERSPENVTFRELCRLCKHFGMKPRKGTGSHRVFKRTKPPAFSLSIQDDGGKAKPYQVRELLRLAEQHGLYSPKEDK